MEVNLDRFIERASEKIDIIHGLMDCVEMDDIKEYRPELYEKLNQDLQHIRMMSGEFKPQQSFLDAWEIWYPKQFNNALKNNEKMHGYLERRPTHLLKLSMIINASRNGDMKLTDEDFILSLALLEEVEVKMPQTF